MTARISARALLELLAGRLNGAAIQAVDHGDKNLFEYWLSQGTSISDITFEPRGYRDDHYVVIKFYKDSKASVLRLPRQLLDDKE